MQLKLRIAYPIISLVGGKKINLLLIPAGVFLGYLLTVIYAAVIASFDETLLGTDLLTEWIVITIILEIAIYIFLRYKREEE